MATEFQYYQLQSIISNEARNTKLAEVIGNVLKAFISHVEKIITIQALLRNLLVF